MNEKSDLKKIISKNLVFLLEVYGLSRKDFCKEMKIKYTTLCDWIGEKSYPRIETLEHVAAFFAINVQDFFVDIEADDERKARVMEDARRMIVRKDYSDTYPANFWNLCGILADSDLEEPEELPIDEDEGLL